MYRYKLIINNESIPNCTSLSVNTFYRSESVKNNMAGGLLIDRISGGQKRRISATISMVTKATLNSLRAAQNLIFVDMQCYDNCLLKSFTGNITAIDVPPALHRYGSETDIIYDKITITIEER